MPIQVQESCFVSSAPRSEDIPDEGLPEIAVCGPSNVGKSSLLNALFVRKGLVKTSKSPGATRLLNVFRTQFDGHALQWVDLPGFGYAKRSKSERNAWADAIEHYLEHREALRLVLVLIDLRRDPSEADLDLLNYLAECRRPALLVGTKADKLSKAQRKPAADRIALTLGRSCFLTSATTQEGVESLRRQCLKRCTEAS